MVLQKHDRHHTNMAPLGRHERVKGPSLVHDSVDIRAIRLGARDVLSESILGSPFHIRLRCGHFLRNRGTFLDARAQVGAAGLPE